jgi:hypothetical protein
VSGSRPSKWIAGRLALAALALGWARPARAQDTTVVIIRPELPGSDTTPAPPGDAVQRIIATFNDSTTTRLTGSFTLPRGARLSGAVALFRGTLRVNGLIEGPVTVINGDLIIGTTGTVDGNVLVVGGRVDLREGGVHLGRTETYDGLAPVYRAPNGLLALRTRAPKLGEMATASKSFQTGRITTTLSLGTGRTYNRVEGLPIVFGPTFTSLGPSGVDARLDVKGIFRPTSDRTKLRDDIGFVVTAELKASEGHRPFGFGGRGYRRILPIEDQPLGSGEAGWSAFLLQRDYRDHYEARGIEGFAYVEPLRHLRVGLSVRQDDERSVPASDPVSLFRNQDAWRPNPLIDDGSYRTARLWLGYDSRNDPVRPTTGWDIHAEVETSRSDDVSPVTLPTAVRPPIQPGRYQFSRLRFDVRRYARLNPTVRANARVVGGGWIGGDPLPVQRRVALGGPDILPGFGFRALNCAPAGFSDPAQTALCDRMLGVELEVRTHLSLGLPIRIRNADVATVQRILGVEQADLVVFGNTGKAWLTGEGPGRVPNDRIPKFGEWDADVGAGIDSGGIGLYLARAITQDRPVRFVIRLQRRF